MNNWPSKKISEVCKVVTGGTPTTKKKNYWNGDILWATPKDMGNLKSKEIDNTERKITLVGLRNSSAKLLPKGSVLLTTRAPIGYVAIASKPIATNQGFKSFVCGPYIFNTYLYYSLKFFVKELQWLGRGSTFTEISKKIVENFKISLPPISEQKMIVGKLERIQEVQRLIEKQIEKARELFETSCGQAFGKIDKKYAQVEIGGVCRVVKGKSPTLKTSPGDYPLVVTANERKTAKDYQFDTQAVCVPLISSTGHGHSDLKRIHYQEGKFALANILAALIALDKKQLISKYLYYYLSYYKDTLLVSLMRGGANVTIPINKLQGVKVPLPPVKIQQKIIDQLEKIESLIEALKKRQTSAADFFESTLDYIFKQK